MAGPVYTEADYAEIIAECEDPDVSFDDVEGRPLTPERKEWVEQLADAMFRDCSIEEQVSFVCDLPLPASVRRIFRLTDPEQSEILSRLPAGLAAQIRSLLPVGVVKRVRG